jgi:hypothetical protein
MAVVKYIHIARFYGRNWRDLLYDFYVNHKKSSYEICEKIRKDTNLIYSDRNLRRWLKRFGYIRLHSKAMKNRVLMGRMDYVKRRKPKRYRWAVGLRVLLISQEDEIKLADAVEATPIQVSKWKDLKTRVPPDYQDKISNYLGLKASVVFLDGSSVKPRGLTIGQKQLMVSRGYQYAANLKRILYENGVSLTELADKLGKYHPTVSRWVSGHHLVSPIEQARISEILGLSVDAIFSKQLDAL